MRPITHICNTCIQEGVYPNSWKTEFANVVPKVFPPTEYGDLRNLSLTEYVSKRFEDFILNESFGLARFSGLADDILMSSLHNGVDTRLTVVTMVALYSRERLNNNC